MNEPTRTVSVTTASGETRADDIAVEEPLEIRLTYGPAHNRQRTVLTVTMRTPGQDRDLAIGYLAAEGNVRMPSDIIGIGKDGPNELRVLLAPDVPFDADRHARSGYTTSSCGVCGKRSIEACLRTLDPIPADDYQITADELRSLPERVRSAQPLFAQTGGIHAAALFDRTGNLVAVREDVGRHNAADKVLGSQFLNGRWPLARHVLFLSGRASFELVQKAAAAGVPVMAAVGAPSSLAVELAGEVGMTLCGFVRDGRFNVYTNSVRIRI